MVEKYKVVYLDYIPKEMNDIHREYTPPEFEYITMESKDPQERIEKAKDADFYMMAGAKIDKAMIDLAPRLKLIHHQGVGFEKTDIEYATLKKIPVCTTPAGTVDCVAEHTVMLILSCMRQLILADRELRKGNFLVWELRNTSYSLLGKTIGLIGFGRIGKSLTKLLLPFNVKILFFDKFVKLSLEEQRKYGVTQVNTMDELAVQSDVISVHMPLIPEDVGYISTNSLFGKMKPTSIFINTARGPLVNEGDLYDVLKNRKIAAAGIDVFEKEPTDVSNPLFTLDNIILTPHIAGGTRDAQIERAKFMFGNMKSVLEGKPLQSCLNADKIKQ